MLARNSFYIEDINQEGASEISHSSFYPLEYECFGPITWGMTSWLFSSSRSQHATEFLMLPAIHGGPAEDSPCCSCFLLLHVSQCTFLSHCFFRIHSTDSLFSLSNLAPVLRTRALERVSESLQSLLHNSFFFCLHALHSLEGFTEDTVKEQSEGIWQSILRKKFTTNLMVHSYKSVSFFHVLVTSQ